MDIATDNTNPAQIRPEDTRIKKVNRTMRLILINFQNTVLSSSLTGKLGFNVFGLKREYWPPIKCGFQFVKFCKLSGDQGSQAPVGPCSVIRKYKIVKVFSNFVEYFQPRRLQIFMLLVSITL